MSEHRERLGNLVDIYRDSSPKVRTKVLNALRDAAIAQVDEMTALPRRADTGLIIYNNAKALSVALNVLSMLAGCMAIEHEESYSE
jgi:hypothetical protein